jgi:hypothetical protein
VRKTKASSLPYRSRLLGLVWISSRTCWSFIRLAVNRLASLPKYSTGLRGSLVSGVSRPMSRTLVERGTEIPARGDKFPEDGDRRQ